MTSTETSNAATRRKKRHRSKRKKVTQDGLLRRVVIIMKRARLEGHGPSWIAERSINPFTRKTIAPSTVTNWIEGYTSGAMTRTMEGALRAVGKKLDIVDR